MGDQYVRRRRTILDRLRPTSGSEGAQHESPAASLDLALPRRGSEQPQFAVPPLNVYSKQDRPLLFHDLLIPATLENEVHLVSQDKKVSFVLGVPFALGSTSRVRLGVKKDGEIDQVYALKEIFVTPGVSPQAGWTRLLAGDKSHLPKYTLHPDDIVNEVNNMIKAKSNLAPHFVVSLNDNQGMMERIYIGMPVMQGTALDVVDRLGRKEDSDLLRIHFTSRLLHQVSFDLQKAHDHGIALGEIKLDNVLINLDGAMAQSDYGGSVNVLSPGEKFLVETPSYRPPEAGNSFSHRDLFKENLFQLGAMLTESVFGESPFCETFWLSASAHTAQENFIVPADAKDYVEDLNNKKFRLAWTQESNHIVKEILHHGKYTSKDIEASPYVKYFLGRLFERKESHSLARLITGLLATDPNMRPNLNVLKDKSIEILKDLDMHKKKSTGEISAVLNRTIRQMATEVGQAQATDEMITTELERERFLGRLKHDDPHAAEKISQEGGLSFESSYATRKLLFGPLRPLLARRNSTGSTVKDFYFRARDQGEAIDMIEEMSYDMQGLDLAGSTGSSRRTDEPEKLNLSGPELAPLTIKR